MIRSYQKNRKNKISLRDPFNLISSYYHYSNQPFSSISIKKLNKKKEKYLKAKYPHVYFNKQNWDKKLRLVIFDVQKINHLKRNQLRWLLKGLGFIIIQKSVWLSAYNQFDVIKRWAKENKLEEKILLIKINKFDFKNENKIISQFWQARSMKFLNFG